MGCRGGHWSWGVYSWGSGAEHTHRCSALGMEGWHLPSRSFASKAAQRSVCHLVCVCLGLSSHRSALLALTPAMSPCCCSSAWWERSLAFAYVSQHRFFSPGLMAWCPCASGLGWGQPRSLNTLGTEALAAGGTTQRVLQWCPERDETEAISVGHSVTAL